MLQHVKSFNQNGKIIHLQFLWLSCPCLYHIFYRWTCAEIKRRSHNSVTPWHLWYRSSRSRYAISHQIVTNKNLFWQLYTHTCVLHLSVLMPYTVSLSIFKNHHNISILPQFFTKKKKISVHPCPPRLPRQLPRQIVPTLHSRPFHPLFSTFPLSLQRVLTIRNSPPHSPSPIYMPL